MRNRCVDQVSLHQVSLAQQRTMSSSQHAYEVTDQPLRGPTVFKMYLPTYLAGQSIQ